MSLRSPNTARGDGVEVRECFTIFGNFPHCSPVFPLGFGGISVRSYALFSVDNFLYGGDTLGISISRHTFGSLASMMMGTGDLVMPYG